MWEGDTATLSSPEAFLLQMSRIPRVEKKLQCLLFMRNYFGMCYELQTILSKVQQAVEQVCWENTPKPHASQSR